MIDAIGKIVRTSRQMLTEIGRESTPEELAEKLGMPWGDRSSGGRNAPTRKGFNMTGGDDDYGDAFKKAKLEHDQQVQGSVEAQRLQAEVDADTAALSSVVLPQLRAAAQKLEPLGGQVEIRQHGRTGITLQPASVAFRITDQQGHKSRAYSIFPHRGTVTVTSADGFDKTGQPHQPKNVSEEAGIQRRDDLTIENLKKLILCAIEEYRNERDAPGARITTIT
jgi:hypothetical protein